MSNNVKYAVVSDLDVMEHIVANNNSLEWDGWDVIHYRRKPTSFMNPRGVFRNGEWHVATRYSPGEDGYVLPKRLLT